MNHRVYPVFSGNNALKQLDSLIKSRFNKSSLFLLTERKIRNRCMPALLKNCSSLCRANIIEIRGGEGAKNIDSCQAIWNYLLHHHAERSDMLINFGGGVITDLGGFAAATYKRGISFINIPTTLIAMTDASLGGKTGINMNGAKNMVGTFTQPEGVFIYPPFLRTLPERQFRFGLAEAFKHALIADKKYWTFLKQLSKLQVSKINNNDKLLQRLIRGSVDIKMEIVSADPNEQDKRKLLNFGHTIGHAVESVFLSRRSPELLLHGEAIAIGMICEAYLSHIKKRLPQLNEITETILGIFPHHHIQRSDFKRIISFMRNDKKNKGGRINFTLLNEIGEGTIDNFCGEGEIKKALEFYSNL